MRISKAIEKTPFFMGFLFSLVAHLVAVTIAIIVLENSAARASVVSEVFTVTLEGGDRIGGISQVPRSDKKQAVPSVAKKSAPPPKKAATPEKKTVAKIDSPTVVEDLEKKKKEAEKKKRDKLAKKKREEEKRKKEEAKKKEALKKEKEAKKKKAEAEQKQKVDAARKREAERKKNEAANKRKARDKALEEAISKAASRYEGESANAGGTGFGAARTGGKGMGGGTLESIEFIAYRNALESHIKSGWHWLPGSKRLAAQAIVSILPNGTVQDVRISQTSGRQDFDTSILRAVYKASPVPQAPAKLYERFREVRITFDSHN